MKLSAAFLFATLAVASAQEARTLKERLVDHREDMFRDHEVRHDSDDRLGFRWLA
jgi:hypothetical protein